MSFGTFNLFNFFQQPNRGKIPPVGGFDKSEVVAGVGHDGNVADFNWPFPYAGNGVPFEVIEGGGGAFQLKLFSDSDIGLRYATVSTTISGGFEGSSENANFSTTTSGAFFPKDSDFGDSYFIFSGFVEASPPDIFPNFISLSGSIIGVETDYSLPFIVFSGKAEDCSPDLTSFRYVSSGIFESSNKDTKTSSIVFMGNFIPTKTDNCNISCGILGFTGYFNKIISSVSLEEDEAVIDYGFASFVSTRG